MSWADFKADFLGDLVDLRILGAIDIMDILPSGNIFRELQDIHDTGYFSAQPSLEDHWQQVMNFRDIS